ncbi:MAG: hypothetical protein HYW07_15740 [Candidatus Latescibacteria bacterium]|nr:hypothetical protein [Candidatus Latescibacterota bacterium]
MKRSNAFCLAALLALAGCSHLSPYYRPDAPPARFPADGDLRQRVLLIGDAGMPQKNEPVLQALEQWAGQQPQRTTVVFLGDNVYESGIPEPDQGGYTQALGYLQAPLFLWKDHLFPARRLHRRLWLPLPVLGSLYPLVRGLRPPTQDLASPTYRSMSAALRGALARYRPLIYAAGHDHSLQVLEGDAASRYYLISGMGSAKKATAVTHGHDTLFAHLHPGFMAVDLLEDGRMLLQVVEAGSAAVVFAHWLYGAD